MSGNSHGRLSLGDGKPVVIVGAGASGLLAARALLRAGHPSVVLVERDRSWSAGPAYATRDPQHLLNVAAGKLSVDGRRPADFVDWIARRGQRVGEDEFLPRSLFGEYVREALCTAATAARDSTLTRVAGDVVAIELDERSADRVTGARVFLADGRSFDAEHVVLALGNPAPRALAGDCDRVINDPWAACLTSRVSVDDSVVIAGSGLTAIDVALTLSCARGHRGPIRMVSRHGLLPRPHTAQPSRPIEKLDHHSVLTARSAVAWIRTAIVDADGDWRAVFDAIRHDTNDIWTRLPERERARLVRHASRYWEVHRHRIAPAAAARINELVSAGQLSLQAGAVTDTQRGHRGKTHVIVRDAHGEHSIISANWIVNCTGPDFNLRRSSEPLVHNLFDSGLARPGPLGLGFDISNEGTLVDQAGRASSAISVVGPLRRGVEWETTAIPDIRMHVETLAPRVVSARRDPAKVQ